MNRTNAILLLILLALGRVIAGEASDRPEWKRYFTDFVANGTIVIADERNESRVLVYNSSRAETRFTPASTFKIPHSLFALEAGVVRDEFEIIPWDGQKRSHPAWNCDHNLRSAMRHSVVWVYQHFARELGEEREEAYLKKTNYGNAVPTGRDPFWIKGDLRISAHEQITFLKKLYTSTLPFDAKNQRRVKDIMLVEAGEGWILRAKAGWSGDIGWWVGWVETAAGPVFFALNIDTPEKKKDLPKREGIARAILTSLNALPAKRHEAEQELSDSND